MTTILYNAFIQNARVLLHSCVFALLWVCAVQAAPLAGTMITNQAQSTYVDTLTSKTALLNSNTVELQVQQIAAFSLTAAQNVNVVLGGTSNLPHRIINMGNGVDTFNLTTTLGLGALNFASVAIYPDANADGIPDNYIPISVTPAMAAGGVFNFVVSAIAATTATLGSTRQIRVNASGTATLVPAPVQSNIDTLTLSSNAVLTVMKSFSVVSGASPNASITATFTVTNTGNATATNVTLNDLIGGVSGLPAFDTTGMSYIPNTSRWNNGVLNDLGTGNPAGITYSAITLGALTTIKATIATLPANASTQLSFQFAVLPGLVAGSAKTNNIASVSYFDGVLQQSANSNTATYTVLAAPPAPDLTLTKSHVGSFLVGIPNSYTLSVKNVGTAATSGAVTVTDTLPAGLTYVPASSGGNGWVCSAVLQVVGCTTSAIASANSNLVNLPITVIPTAAAVAASPVVNNAVVSGGGEPFANNTNNSASDPTVVGLPATVSGYVWLDVNHDKIFTPGEIGVAGWQAELMNAAGTVIATGLTNAAGLFFIGAIAPGAGYQLRFRDPSTNIVYASPILGDGTVIPPGSIPPPVGTVVVNGVITGLTLNPGDNVVELDMPLDPSGVIYDSITRLPVPGAVVTLSCPTCTVPFNPALHLFGGAVNQAQTVGSTGYYQFLLFASAPAGLYQIQVTPPAGYASPSTLIPAQIVPLTPPTGVGKFMVQAQVGPPPVGSPTTYYLNLNVFTGMQDVINNHIPLDPLLVAGSGLFVSKLASRTTAEPGDFIDYTVTTKNVTTLTLPGTLLVDNLPRGFTYELGTARLNGLVIADPVGGKGPTLTFPIGAMAPNSTMTLTYRVAVGITATLGTGINSAQANSGVARSNVAQARVQLVQGIFSDKAYILGTVYMDCNRNHIQEADEPGIPAVRLYLENGTFVVTDTDGKYSFYGVDPRTHHLKLDKTTLPSGALLEVLANRHAGVAGGRFVDLKKSELHRADFASNTCTPSIMAEVKARHAKDTATETERALKYVLNPTGAVIVPADPRALPAAGELAKTTGASAPSYQPLSPAGELNNNNSNLPNAPVAPVPQINMDDLLPDLDNKLDFVDLKDKQVLPIAQAAVRIKGGLGSVFELSVNGDVVNATRVGKKSTLPSKQLEAWEYIGVVLKPGENVLTVKQFDPFGNERAKQTITVIAPDQLAKIKIDAPATIEANGRDLLHVKVQLVDARDVTVNARTYLTLEATQGRWQVKDLDPKEPGIQVAMEDGQAEFDLLPPTQPGQETLRILSGVLKGEHVISYLPELRPLIAAGIIEGSINTHSLKASQLLPVTAQDSFEQEIQRIKRGNAAARAAMFLKGKVKGEYLLTLAYDSDKNVKDALFRDIQPNEFYPVYGDSSNKGFDAQSTSRLYVRVDKDKSYLLYGDFATRSLVPARNLSQYNRSLTGVKEHYENNGVMVNAFASQDTLRQVIQEIPANGTSGPFQLTNNGALINSEKVEILTRDRNQPAIILKIEPQTRFADYEIEQFTGRLLFKGPVASLDSNFNPRSMRITYELDQGGTAFWVTGADGQVKLTDTLEVGAMIVKDSNPMNPTRVMGVNTTLKIAEKASVVAEVATSNTVLGAGKAQRIEFRQDGKDFQGRIYSGRSDPNFDNAASMLNKGRVETGMKGTYRVTPTLLFSGEMISSGDQVTKAQRDGVMVKVEKTLNDIFRVELGVRDSKDSTGAVGIAPTQVTSARVKATSQIPWVKGLSVNGEYEQDVKDSAKHMAAVGAEYQMMNRGRLYARHEFMSSLSSPFALNAGARTNTTVFGIDTDYTPNTHVFSEYRARGVMDGREAEAAVGLRNKWEVAEGLRVNAGIERVVNLAGGAGRSAQAYTGAVEYTRDPFWKGSGRLEYRTSDTSDGWLNSIDIARRLTDSWTVIGKQVFSENATKGLASGVRIQHRMQGGLAWRDLTDHTWNALSKFEHRRESDTTTAATVKRVMDIVSLHVNYESDSDWQASGHYAAKWLDDQSLGLSSRSNTHLASGRIMWDLTERWDAGILGSVMGDRGFRSLRYGVGAEVGYLLQENLWLSAGYNFFGFKDVDLIGQNATDRGVFIRLRFKFDEDLFTGIANRFQRAGGECQP